MKVIVFGATGTIGKSLIDQLLSDHYSVTAFSRSLPEQASSKTDDLQYVRGDVTNYQHVLQAIKGHDAVFIALGSGKQRVSTVRSAGTLNIIRAMKEVGIKRLICQTTLGCGDSKGNLNFFWKRIMFGWYLKQVFLDHELQEEYVRKSGLDWTIVRPAAFTDGQKTKTYKHGFDGYDKRLTLKISRADVAHFMLETLKNNQYVHQTPGLSY